MVFDVLISDVDDVVDNVVDGALVPCVHDHEVERVGLDGEVEGHALGDAVDDALVPCGHEVERVPRDHEVESYAPEDDEVLACVRVVESDSLLMQCTLVQ